MRLRWWRLPSKALDKLDLPDLPKGYRWVLTQGQFAKVAIRRRVALVGWNQDHSNYIRTYTWNGGTRSMYESYRAAVARTYEEFTQKHASFSEQDKLFLTKGILT